MNEIIENKIENLAAAQRIYKSAMGMSLIYLTNAMFTDLVIESLELGFNHKIHIPIDYGQE